MNKFVAILLFIPCICSVAQAQLEGLEIFGYFQGTVEQRDYSNGGVEKTFNAFKVPQFNLFVTKDLGANFSAMVNLAMTTNYNSEKNWGGFSLSEAFVRYSPKDWFTVKVGQLIPKFSNMNVVKDKTPLLPYIFRPLVYESSVGGNINSNSFIVDKAAIEVSGTTPLGPLMFDYAVFTGLADDAYITTAFLDQNLAGSDTSKFKMIGAHIGFGYDNVKLGVSFVWDREKDFVMKKYNVPRKKFDVDFSAAYYGFVLDAEYINVSYSLVDDLSSIIASYAAQTQAAARQIIAANLPNKLEVLTGDVGKNFYYVNLTYDISTVFYAYGGYSYLDDKSIMLAKDGLQLITVGAGCRVNDSVILKAQYADVKLVKDKDPMVMISARNAHTKVLFGGVSVYF